MSAEYDVASWDEIKITAMFTVATTAIFLFIFEYSRRLPSVASVFDRRRAAHPSRTPPPLMKSWFFGLEWLFLSVDARYNCYSEAVYRKKAIETRKKKRLKYAEKLEKKIKAQEAIDIEDGFADDDDGKFSTATDDATMLEEDTITSLEQINRHKNRRIKRSSGPIDLDDSVFSESQAPQEISVTSRDTTVPMGKLSYSSLSMNSSSTSTPLELVKIRGHFLPKSIAQYALAGDLSDEQLKEYEELVRKQEEKEQKEYEQICASLHSTLSSRKSSGIPNRLRYFLFGKEPPTLIRERSTVGIPSSSEGRMLCRGMRHLKSTSELRKRPLSSEDTELLRCVGLDTFVMLRFLRLCFNCTFYPFLVSCIFLIPLYYTSSYHGGDDEASATEGYFSFTMNRLPPGSYKHWIPWAYAIMFYLFMLRMLWIEWETFLALRFDFLANGDMEMDITHSFSQLGDESLLQNPSQLSLSSTSSEAAQLISLQQEQFRNSCLVEFIPNSHHRDRELFEFFDAVFPGSVKRAEILLNTNKLTKLINERQKVIQNYEDLYAKHIHARAVYRKRMDKHEKYRDSCRGCFHPLPKDIKEPMVKNSKRCSLCSKKFVQALPFYISEIKRLNHLINEEHQRITEEKLKQNEDSMGSKFASLSKGLNYVTGINSNRDLTCDTGFVEFKSLSAKQFAIQCNISGTTEFMLTTSAPDPRDMLWDNATVPRRTINLRMLQCVGLLAVGVFFWSAVVVLVLSLSTLEWVGQFLPSQLIPPQDSFLYPLLQGYVPVISLEFLMFFFQVALKILATQYIAFKTKSEIDTFVYQWHYYYRLANLLIIILSVSLKDSMNNLWTSPILFLEALASGISRSSQFFLNNAIVAAGTETMWELAQMPSMIIHFIMYKFIKVEAKSQRALEKLQEPKSFEWGDVIPAFIFSFIAAISYSAIVPLVTGVCSVYFFLARKVYKHQALFVYSQQYESGGKLMYKLNRTIFNYCYISIIFFSTVLLMKNAKTEAGSFCSMMIIITFLVDRKVNHRFVQPSMSLALTNARMMDHENKNKISSQSQIFQNSDDKDSFYLYRQPQLHKAMWETEPRPYR